MKRPILNVLKRTRAVRRELEGVIRGLRREGTIMENQLARIGTLADRWGEENERRVETIGVGDLKRERKRRRQRQPCGCSGAFPIGAIKFVEGGRGLFFERLV